MAFQAKGPALARVQKTICLDFWSVLKVVGGAARDLKGQTTKGHLYGIGFALYPIGSERSLKGFKQEFNMASFGCQQQHIMENGSGREETEAGDQC